METITNIKLENYKSIKYMHCTKEIYYITSAFTSTVASATTFTTGAMNKREYSCYEYDCCLVSAVNRRCTCL